LISALNKGDFAAAAKVPALNDLDIKIVNHYAPELFERAIHNKNLKLFKALIAIPRLHISSGEYCPLRHGTQKGLANFIRELVKVNGLKANVPDKGGNTALLHALLGRWSQDKAVDLVKALIQAPGLKVNFRGDFRKTALHHAMERRWYEVAELLMDSGANPKMSDSDGKSPLSLAISNDDTPAGLFTRMLSFSGEEDVEVYADEPDAAPEMLDDDDLSDFDLNAPIAAPDLPAAESPSAGTDPSRPEYAASGRT